MQTEAVTHVVKMPAMKMTAVHMTAVKMTALSRFELGAG